MDIKLFDSELKVRCVLRDKLFAALSGRKKLSAGQIQKLRQTVEDLE